MRRRRARRVATATWRSRSARASSSPRSTNSCVEAMMNRRALLIGLALAAPVWAAAQDASRIPRIGFLGNSTPELEANLVQPFRDGLRDLGYVDGKNLV